MDHAPREDEPRWSRRTRSPAPRFRRKLTRSTTDKHVAGVAGGLGRYFGIDPVIFRVGFGAATLVSGIGLIAYIALRLASCRRTRGAGLDRGPLTGDDDRASPPCWRSSRSRRSRPRRSSSARASSASPRSASSGSRSTAASAARHGDDPARAIARATLALLALAAALGAATGVGFIAAIGGGTAVAVIAIFAGFGLIVAGLLGGPRWLILPAIVLVLPLAVVSAADIDLHGGVGERSYRPASVAQLRPEYRLGVGQLDLDLRSCRCPPGRPRSDVRLGMGEARVRVPADACVSTAARSAPARPTSPSPPDEGTNLDIDQHASAVAGRPRLLVTADVGVGHLQIDRTLGSGCA